MFQVPESKGTKFEFEYEGETYSLPAYESLPIETLMEFTDRVSAIEGEQLQQLEATRIVLDIFNKYLPGVLDGMTADQVGALMGAYYSTGVTPGESTVSSD